MVIMIRCFFISYVFYFRSVAQNDKINGLSVLDNFFSYTELLPVTKSNDCARIHTAAKAPHTFKFAGIYASSMVMVDLMTSARKSDTEQLAIAVIYRKNSYRFGNIDELSAILTALTVFNGSQRLVCLKRQVPVLNSR